MKVTDCQVVFDPKLIDSVDRGEVEKCQKEVFHGLLDVTRLAFQYAEREITGEFDDWTPRSIEKMFVSELIATQTPEGSTLKRKVKYCPVLHKSTISGLQISQNGLAPVFHLHWPRLLI